MNFKFLNKMTSIMGFSIPIISELCIFVDWAIYAIASFALQTFFQLAEISSKVFTNMGNSEVYATVQSILSRVMVLAGVYALFRLGIMLINLMINPDNTKKVGQTGTDFIKGAIIAVVLLASSKLIFSQLGEFQYLVLNSDNRLIPKLIYGTDVQNPVTYSDKKEADMFTNRVWSVFFQPKDGYATSGAISAWENVRNGGATIASMVGRNYNEFDYYPFISGIVGMMLIYYFVIFSIELGSRIIKLVTLQVLSPIPIIMSVDPSQKNKLTNFIKAYAALYLQIFVRVFTIYIAFIVLDLIQTVLSEYGSGLLTNSTSTVRIMAGNFIIDVIMIFAVFQAAKELPKVIEDALGLKLGIQTSGKGSFGALVGGIIGGGAGLIGGGIAGAVGARGAGWATTLGAGLMGAGSGLWKGGVAGSRGKDIAAKVTGVTGAVKSSNILGGNIRGTGGVKNYLLGGAENFFGGKRRDEATLKEYDKDIKEQEKYQKMYKDGIDEREAIVSEKEGQINTINRASELREKVENSFSDAYGDVNYWLDNDKDYIAAQELVRTAENETVRHDAERELDSQRDRVLSSYNATKNSYFENNFSNMASGTGPVDATFRNRLNTYNEFVRNNGMSHKEITSYRAIPGSGSSPTKFEDLARMSRSEVKTIQAEVDKQRSEIKFAQTKNRMREDKKDQINKAKDDYTKSEGYVRRNERKVDPIARAFRRPPMGPPPGGRPPHGPGGTV